MSAPVTVIIAWLGRAAKWGVHVRPGFRYTEILPYANQRLVVADLTPLHAAHRREDMKRQTYQLPPFGRPDRLTIGFAGYHTDIYAKEIYQLNLGFARSGGSAELLSNAECTVEMIKESISCQSRCETPKTIGLGREGPMAAPQRILVLGSSFGGGNWPPLAAVTVGLYQAGHTVKCFGDTTIAQDFASAAIAVEVLPAGESLRTFIARWQAVGASGPSPLAAWAEASLPAVRSLVKDFRPRIVLSDLFTMELARLTKTACGLRWCFVNPSYYFGLNSMRAFEADFVGRARYFYAGWMQAVVDADLVLHGTDPIFDPPPPSLPRHHHYVGPLMWEQSNEAPAYLDVPGAPWALVTLSSLPQEGEMTLARTALQTLAEFPIRVVLTLTAGHPRDELGPVPTNARIELFVPHSEVLKRGCLLVSHAGHGIVTKALYYGVPMVLVPWDRDQPGVAARAAALGVAEVIARQDLTELRLSAAIRRVLGTPSYQEKATRIAGRLQARDAVAMACARIEELMETT